MASGESKRLRRYDKENLLWQSTVAIKSVGPRHDEGWRAPNRKGRAAMTRKTYCGNQVLLVRASCGGGVFAGCGVAVRERADG